MTTVQLRNLFLVLIIVGSGLVLLGALAKFRHWPAANVLLPIGLLAEMVAAVGFLFISLRARRGRR